MPILINNGSSISSSGGASLPKVVGVENIPPVITESSIKLFQFAEDMPTHLLVETPDHQRLIHEFPENKTYRFTPVDQNQHFEGVKVDFSGESATPVLGQYSDIPLYIFEPNMLIVRNTYGHLSFPANNTINPDKGFYFFGTISGWAGGNNNRPSRVDVFIGDRHNHDNSGGNIGFSLANNGLFILDGDTNIPAENSSDFLFDKEDGVCHMYRYAVYVDDAGLITYYILDLNTGEISTGKVQGNLTSLSSSCKFWISYKRTSLWLNNTTSCVATGETWVVVNSTGDEGQDRWNTGF